MATVMLLGITALMVAGAAEAAVYKPGTFAKQIWQAVAARTNPASESRVVVVVSVENDPDPQLIEALRSTLPLPASVKPLHLVAPEGRYLRALEDKLKNPRGIAAIVALDLKAHPAQAVAQYARDHKVLTISSKQEDVNVLGLAIDPAKETTIYYLAAVLSETKVSLSNSFLAITRVPLVKAPVVIAPDTSQTSSLWKTYVNAQKPLPRTLHEAGLSPQILDSTIRQLQNIISGNSGEFEVKSQGPWGPGHYLPHFDLGRALWAAGDCECALKEWERSEAARYILTLSEYQELQTLKADAKCRQAISKAPSPSIVFARGED